MDDKTRILAAIRRNKPPAMDLPLWTDLKRSKPADLYDRFMSMVANVGGAVEAVDRADVGRVIAERYPAAALTASVVSAYRGTMNLDEVEAPEALEALDVFVCEGVLGVAENGAIWVPEQRIVFRVAPFIAQHLVILLDPSAIVSDMHDAYDRLDVSENGFGVFIAGPSKTADIEQSLVLGAHGPRSLRVLLVEG